MGNYLFIFSENVSNDKTAIHLFVRPEIAH